LSGGQVVVGSNPAAPINMDFPHKGIEMYKLEAESTNMDRIWLNSYEKNVPADINPDAYNSILEIFDESCLQYKDHPAFYNMGEILTYDQLNQYSYCFAAYLQKELHTKKGSRFAIMLPNILQYPIAMFGAMRAGLIIVNVNPLYTPDELVHQLNDAKADSIICLSIFAQTVQKALPKLPNLKNIIITHPGDVFPWFKSWAVYFLLKFIRKKIPNWFIPQAISFKKVIARGKYLTLTPVTLEREDIAFLQYTGGTTGISKGAILTHRNIIANIQQAVAWFGNALTLGKEIVITALPLYHIFSLTANGLFFMKVGGVNVLITNPRDIPGMVKEMKKFRFTAITGVNTLFNGLLNNKEFSTVDFSRLHLALGGGAAVQKAVAERWQAVTHTPLLEAYGLTEASPCVTINPAHLPAYNGTVGLPVSSTWVTILDEQDQPLSIDQAGELAVKGPQVMRGYWQNKSETDKVFTKDGWLLTGDIASINSEGFVRILERKKDLILVSGFNVYPNEIEGVLVQCPGVKEAAVVGVKDDQTGEAVKAFIVKEDPALSAANITQFAQQFLTSYKIPKSIEFCQELPKTNIGKVLRRALKNLSS
jgi:long-chain acyl-CoA synthetase